MMYRSQPLLAQLYQSTEMNYELFRIIDEIRINATIYRLINEVSTVVGHHYFFFIYL